MRIPIALVTDAPRHRVDQRLGIAKLARYFDPIVAAEDTPNGKADTAPYDLLLQRTNLKPFQVLMVGDHPLRDVGIPGRAGLVTALARYGLPPEFEHHLEGNQPDVALDAPGDLLELLPLPPASSR